MYSLHPDTTVANYVKALIEYNFVPCLIDIFPATETTWAGKVFLGETARKRNGTPFPQRIGECARAHVRMGQEAQEAPPTAPRKAALSGTKLSLQYGIVWALLWDMSHK